ncbi:MAG: histidine phosphatase family protein [Hyphomonas sp.]|nr:histidine phosphatase family protein [Hyphomonas sp.]
MLTGQAANPAETDQTSTERIVLIRHGATDWTEAGLLQGHADRALSTAGVQAVRALKPMVKDLASAHVVTSDLRRCTRTATLLGLTPAVTASCWREIDPGKWTGEAVVERHEQLDAWQRGRLVPPAGEARPDFSARIGRALDALLSLNKSTVVLVAHGQVIREIVCRLCAIAPHGLGLPDLASASVVDPVAGTLLSYAATPTLITGYPPSVAVQGAA